MRKMSFLSIVAAAVGTICIEYYLLCGILYSFTMSGLWIWFSFGLILWFGCLWKVLIEPRIHNGRKMLIYRRLKSVCLSIFILFLAVFLLFEGFVISKWIAGYTNTDEAPDAVIILGAGVNYDRPGYALENRIDAAYKFICNHPGIAVIACGGLGEGDIITEADCIRHELIRLGVPEETIFTEQSSTTTVENFLYGAKLLPEWTDSIAVVTSGFHQFRAILTGKTSLDTVGANGISLIPVSAEYKNILLPYSMVREFAAFTMDLTHGNIRIG